ncbi:MAG: hypothetical protein IKG99_07690 [Bacteroidaceae bacterium]|nr:hypothetical protein [Bacteroidaceae bacterium]
MKNLYYNQIVELLEHKPEGMKLQTIVKHVYNQNCGLFERPDLYKKMYSSISMYLWKQSKKKRSPFDSVAGKWGCYRLKRGFVIQLELCFDDFTYDEIQPKKKKKLQVEQLPNLFGW